MRTLNFSAGFIIGMIITVACFVMSAHVKAPTALVDEQPVLVAPSNASTTSYDDHCAGLRELTADADAYLPSIPQLRIRSYHDTDGFDPLSSRELLEELVVLVRVLDRAHQFFSKAIIETEFCVKEAERKTREYLEKTSLIEAQIRAMEL